MGTSARRRRAERRAAKKDPEARGGTTTNFNARVAGPMLKMEAGQSLLHKSWRDMLWMLAIGVAVYCLIRAVMHDAVGMDKVLFFGFEFLGAGSFLAGGRFCKTCAPGEGSMFLNTHYQRGLALAMCQLGLWAWFLNHEEHGEAMQARNWPLATLYFIITTFSYKMMESQALRMQALRSAVKAANSLGGGGGKAQ